MLDIQQIAPETARPLRREEYDRLVELGYFQDERVELLYGVIVSMSPQKAPHSGCIQVLTRLLVSALMGRAEVRIQAPLAVAADSEPEPDVAVVALGDPFTAHPAWAFLVIEVADSSLHKDLTVKGRLYASAGIPEYWVVDLHGQLVRVHTEPQADGYGRVTAVRRGDAVAMQAFPDVQLAVGDFLPPARA